MGYMRLVCVCVCVGDSPKLSTYTNFNVLAQAAAGQIRFHYYDIQIVMHTEQCSDALLPLKKIKKKKQYSLDMSYFRSILELH